MDPSENLGRRTSAMLSASGGSVEALRGGAAPGLVLEPLLARVAAGDPGALSALFDRTHALVFGLCLRLLGDRSHAEEVALDVFLRVWRGAAGFDRLRGSPLTWLLAIARNRSLDCRRRIEVRARCEEALAGNLEPHNSAHDAVSEPQEQQLRAERRDRVRAALGELPSDQREALELAYLGGLTQLEISARLGSPLGTVKTRIRLGLAKLRERLASLERDP